MDGWMDRVSNERRERAEQDTATSDEWPWDTPPRICWSEQLTKTKRGAERKNHANKSSKLVCIYTQRKGRCLVEFG